MEFRAPFAFGTANSVVAWSQVRGGYAAGMGTTGLPGEHMAASPHGVPAEMRCLPRYDRRGDLTMNASRVAQSMVQRANNTGHTWDSGLLNPRRQPCCPLNQPRWFARVQFNRGQQPQPRRCDCPTGLNRFIQHARRCLPTVPENMIILHPLLCNGLRHYTQPSNEPDAFCPQAVELGPTPSRTAPSPGAQGPEVCCTDRSRRSAARNPASTN